MVMTVRKDLIISIENQAEKIEPAIVKSVLAPYGTYDLDTLSTHDLTDIFNELHTIEADMD